MLLKLAALLSGLLFGVGILLSGMANPVKVQGFLDLFGRWDPSLALVMAGAISVGLIGFYRARQKTHSYLGVKLELPTNRKIDVRLIVGSLLFGIGWGLIGICPGPALVLLGMGLTGAVIFVVAMLIGIGIYRMTMR